VLVVVVIEWAWVVLLERLLILVLLNRLIVLALLELLLVAWALLERLLMA